ncbi:phosphonate ABC transporter, permease protein PhnE [Bdellovibrio sp. HCB2-146]|uniref:phosphonate ABC transporter, permease protein PhnE n=1 Tax=Bdellovibrio sp. HCB2-146 TaxID=3394362 RepID=UPI0039BD821D
MLWRRTLLDIFSGSFLFSSLAILVLGWGEEDLIASPTSLWYLLCFIIVSAGLSFLLNYKKIRTWGEVLFGPTVSQESPPWYRTFWAWQFLITFVAALIVASIKTDFSFIEILDQQGFSGAIRLFQGMLDPNWSLLPRAILNIIETIFMAFLATTLAIPFAFILSFFCARNIMRGPMAFSIYFVLRTFLNVVRSIEALIWAIIFSVWVGIGPFAGMLALMIHSIASLAKQYSEMVESVEEGPIEAIESTGANKLQCIWFAIVPQVLLPYISFTVYRWDINVRMATVIGLVGGGGIGTMLIQYQGQAMWREVGCIIFVIAVVVWALDQASAYIREALK